MYPGPGLIFDIEIHRGIRAAALLLNRDEEKLFMVTLMVQGVA
jgi:hypothetical protein